METAVQKTISFGRPVMEPYLIPVIHNSTPSCINVPFMVEGQEYRVTSFALHNCEGASSAGARSEGAGSEGAKPYGIVITDNVEKLDMSLHGKALCTHPLFPNGADIVFVEIKRRDLLKARLYEKEEGEVDFSERGACAAFVAARILQKTYESAVVSMGGKVCRVEWDGVDGDVIFMPDIVGIV